MTRIGLHSLVLTAAGVAMAMAIATPAVSAGPAPAPAGGGGGGGGGGSIWAATWWSGNPQGGGPYVPGTYNAAAVCIWTDVGGTVGDMTAALSTAGLPRSFWPIGGGGSTPGSRALIRWARRVSGAGGGSGGITHFDVIACPTPAMVPASGADMYTAIPPAISPAGEQFVWVYWDTVPDPPSGALPPIVGSALSVANLPGPAIHTSPSSVGPIRDATVVNFPTWFWIDPSAWRRVVARAAGGGLVATVWAVPQDVVWRSSWDYTDAAANPEHGVDLQPTVLDLTCSGPGDAYTPEAGANAASPDCGATFTQSTFGAWVPLEATISWEVWWTLTSTSGVVGGEGELPVLYTTSSRPLRVAQIESLVSSL